MRETVPLRRLQISGCLLLAAVALLAPPAPAAPAEGERDLPAGPRLLWFDPQGLVPFGLEAVGEELAMMGRVMGVDLRLVAAATRGRREISVSCLFYETYSATARIAEGHPCCFGGPAALSIQRIALRITERQVKRQCHRACRHGEF